MRKRNLDRLLACAAVALVVIPSFIATMSSAQAPAPPAATPTPPPLPRMPPSLVPARVIDLMTADGSALFGAQWKIMEAKIVEVPAIALNAPSRTNADEVASTARPSLMAELIIRSR